MKEKEILIQIERYIKGELSRREVDELWVRFLENPEYYNWFETELHLKHIIKKEKEKSEQSIGAIHEMEAASYGGAEIRSKNRMYRAWVLAAAAVVVIGFGLHYFSIGEKSGISTLAIDDIDQSELVGADILRSDDYEADETDVLINRALAAAYNNESDEAIRQYRSLMEKPLLAEQRVRIELNLGILLYNEAEYETAAGHFSSVLDIEEASGLFEEKAWWFLGNAYLNLDRPEEAREAVFNAYSLDGRYNSAALALLKRLDLKLGQIPSEEQPDEAR